MSMPSYDPNNDPSTQSGYGQQQPYAGGQGQAGRPVRNGLGTAALVVGILALVTSWTVFGGIVLGIVAIILGFVGRGRVKKAEATNGGVALAGIILGVLSLIIGIVVVVAGVAFFNSDTVQNTVQCVQDAGDNQAAIDACNQQLNNDLGN